MFDLSEHTLLQIGTWAEVAILVFMVWEHYEPRLRGGGVSAPTAHAQRGGVLAPLWENRTIIVALVGLGIVAWLHLRPAPQIEFTPAWLTSERQNTFKSGALSIINASGNPSPTRIEPVAEPEAGKFAYALVDMFITSGLPIQIDSQGNRFVGVPTHRLGPGITIVAPVPSLAAETVRVGFERIGIQTRRSIDRSRNGDYLIVEVGSAP